MSTLTLTSNSCAIVDQSLLPCFSAILYSASCSFLVHLRLLTPGCPCCNHSMRQLAAFRRGIWQGISLVSGGQLGNQTLLTTWAILFQSRCSVDVSKKAGSVRAMRSAIDSPLYRIETQCQSRESTTRAVQLHLRCLCLCSYIAVIHRHDFLLQLVALYICP